MEDFNLKNLIVDFKKTKLRQMKDDIGKVMVKMVRDEGGETGPGGLFGVKGGGNDGAAK